MIIIYVILIINEDVGTDDIGFMKKAHSLR